MENFVDEAANIVQTLLIYLFNGYYVAITFLLSNLWLVLMLAAFVTILLIVRRETMPPV